jgi:hypothetical protein
MVDRPKSKDGSPRRTKPSEPSIAPNPAGGLSVDDTEAMTPEATL